MIIDWIKGFFSKKEKTVLKSRIKRPYRGNTIIEEYQMPSVIEQQDHVNSNIMIDNGDGQLMPASQSVMNGLLYRPDNYTGLNPNNKIMQLPPRVPPAQQSFPQQGYPQGYPQQYPQQGQGYPQQNPYPDQNYQQEPYRQQPQPINHQPQMQPKRSYPYHEIFVMDNAYHVRIDLPDIDENNTSIDFIDSTLKISGCRDSSAVKERNAGNTVSESVSTIPQHLLGTFEYTFSFKKMVDETNISVDYVNGVLRVVLPHRVKGDKVTLGLKKKG